MFVSGLAPWMRNSIPRNTPNEGQGGDVGGGAVDPIDSQTPFVDPFLAEVDDDDDDESGDGYDPADLTELFKPKPQVGPDGKPIQFDEDDDDWDGDKTHTPNGADSHAEANAAATTALAAELQTAITSATLPEDLIPDNFDPSDPTQMRTMLTKMHQNAMRSAIALTMKPFTLGMKQLKVHLESQFESQINQKQGEQSSRTKLLAAVPAMGTKANRAVLLPVLRELKGQGKTVAEQARALNAIANQLKLTGSSKKPAGTKKSEDGKVTTKGKDALDSLFGPMT